MIETVQTSQVQQAFGYPKEVDWYHSAQRNIKNDSRNPHCRKIRWIGIIDLMQDLGKSGRLTLLFINPKGNLREDCFCRVAEGARKPQFDSYFFNFESVFETILYYQKQYSEHDKSKQFLHVIVEEVASKTGLHLVSAILPTDGSVGYLHKEPIKILPHDFIQWIENLQQENKRLTVLKQRIRQ